MNRSTSICWFAATAVVAFVGAAVSLPATAETPRVVAGGQPETTSPAEYMNVSSNTVSIPFGQGNGLFDVYGYIDSWPAGELIINRTGQPPEPPIILAPNDYFALHDIPIALFETVTVSLGPVGGTPLFVEVVTPDPAAPPPADCAVVICGWELEEVVYPDWVDVTLGVADVRAVTVVVTSDRDRSVVGPHTMELGHATASIRLTGLQPGTAYSTEYLIHDHHGHIATAATGSFQTAR